MQTLHECMMYVKGCEYVVAILFFTGFIAFWQLVSGGRGTKGEEHGEDREGRTPLTGR